MANISARPPLGRLWHIALRDLRGSARHFVVLLLSLVLGVGSIAAVGLLLASAKGGIERDSKGLLGGDMMVRTLYEPVSDEAKAWLAQRGEVLEYASLRTMARRTVAAKSPDAINAQIAELKAVPPEWPLAGTFKTDPMLEHSALYRMHDGHYGAAVEPELLRILEMEVGEHITLGKINVVIRAIITHEPDRLGANYSLGPRVMISREALQASGLSGYGSMTNYALLTLLGEQYEVSNVSDALMEQFDDGGYQLRTYENAAPGIRRALNRLGLFLTFAAITTLLIGGIGIANAAQSYLSSRMMNIARLKCLGATCRDVTIIYGMQLALLVCVGIMVGLGVAVAVYMSLLGIIAGVLPLPLMETLFVKPLLAAAGYGLLAALMATIPVLAGAITMPATHLLRSATMQQRAGLRLSWPVIICCIGGFTAMMVLTGIYAENIRLTQIFFGALLVAGLVCYGLARLIIVITRRLSFSDTLSLPNRLAMSNMARPGAMTTSFTLSLGLSLTLVVTLGIVAANFYQQLRYAPPELAPDFFVIDIQPYQYDEFVADISAQSGVTKLALTPMVRGRITHRNDEILTPDMVEDRVRWALQGERGITYMEEAPDNSIITDGEWWPADYAGEPLISFADELAKGMGIAVGDTMTFNVNGREVEARVASLREIDWSSLQMNFSIIMTPGVFPDTPPLYIGTIYAENAYETAVLRHLLKAHPSISVIRLKDALAQVAGLFGAIATLILIVASLAIIAGILVIIGSLGSGLRQRAYEGILLNVLGQTHRAIGRVVLREIAYLTVGGTFLALLLGSALSYALIDIMLLPRWLFIAPIYVATLVLAAMLVGGLTFWLIRRMSVMRPMHYLRNE